MGEPAADPAISYDLPCPRCGYNLRGLSPKSYCPECGQQTSLALRGNLLRYADAIWVRAIKRGAWCEAGWLLLIPAILIGSIAWPMVYLAATTLAASIFTAGCFFLTVYRHIGDFNRSFIAIRILGVVGLAGTVGSLFAESLFTRNFPQAPCILAAAMSVPAFLMKMLLLRDLARQMFSSQADEAITVHLWILGLSAFVCGLEMAVVMLGAFALLPWVILTVFGFCLVAWINCLYAVASFIELLNVEIASATQGGESSAMLTPIDPRDGASCE